MKITSDVKNGRKIAMIKDSYGNAFAPYLASHYEEVYVLDYRYFTIMMTIYCSNHFSGKQKNWLV